MDGFTIFWIIFMVVICVLRYKLPHLRSSGKNKFVSDLNWQNDPTQAHRLGNIYHDNYNRY